MAPARSALAAPLCASLVLVAGCGGGGGSKPPPAPDVTAVEQWAATYDGSADGDDLAAAIAAAADNTIIVAGSSESAGGTLDIVAIKYDAEGNQLWAVRYDGPAGGNDEAQAIAIDPAGNAYVAGRSEGDGTGFDFVVIKYAPDGAHVWTARYDGDAHGDDMLAAIAFDAQGAVLVTGSSIGANGLEDCATVKLDPAGVQAWVARYDGTAGGSDAAAALVADTQGNTYVTGRSQGTGTSFDCATIKYDAAGNQVWAQRFDGSAHEDDSALAIALDPEGNICIAGSVKSQATGYDGIIIKYEPSGFQRWFARYDGPAHADDGIEALALDAAGNAYVAGSSRQAADKPYDYFTAKFSPAGAQLWAQRYDGPAKQEDIASALALDTAGNVYVTGWSESADTGFDFATLKYSPTGTLLWEARYDGPAHNDDWGAHLALTPGGMCVVTGNAMTEDGDSQEVTVAWGERPSS